MRPCLVLLLINALAWSATAGEPASPPPPLFAADPGHPWNELQRILFLRTGPDGRVYGMDEPDPLLFRGSTHLLVGDGHQAAVRVLDRFLDRHDERLIADPLKRLILQHDCWALFDWLAERERDGALGGPARELRIRLATIMKRLALGGDVLEELPDNLALALRDHGGGWLPAELAQKGSPYACVGVNGGDPTAPVHQRAFGGRSAFLVFILLPGGRQATVEYLESLARFRQPWVASPRPDSGPSLIRNPATPQFPDGTRLALVRRLIAINDFGGLEVTPITESIQLRIHLHVSPVTSDQLIRERADSEEADQEVHEFVLRRRSLFAGRGGLEEVGATDLGFNHINPVSNDPFEATDPVILKEAGPTPELRSCGGCHRLPGVFSFNFVYAVLPRGDGQAAEPIRRRARLGRRYGARRQARRILVGPAASGLGRALMAEGGREWARSGRHVAKSPNQLIGHAHRPAYQAADPAAVAPPGFPNACASFMFESDRAPALAPCPRMFAHSALPLPWAFHVLMWPGAGNLGAIISGLSPAGGAMSG